MKLIIENIRHEYRDTRFYFDSLISTGLTGITGPSGSGKTTLLNIISGIQAPGQGRIIMNDKVFFDKSKKINIKAEKRNIAYVFQNSLLFPHLTVKQNLLYSSRYVKNQKSLVSFIDVSKLLHLNHLLTKKPFQLSGGEKQRVAIGRSLLTQPDLLLLDEPFSNLDKKIRNEILECLVRIHENMQIPMLIVSHEPEDILKLTDSILHIDSGEIKYSGNYNFIDDLRENSIPAGNTQAGNSSIIH